PPPAKHDNLVAAIKKGIETGEKPTLWPRWSDYKDDLPRGIAKILFSMIFVFVCAFLYYLYVVFV
ncbi:MAG: hypothetical protein AAGC96_02580, partial [Pseudomonadota bacterium]